MKNRLRKGSLFPPCETLGCQETACFSGWLIFAWHWVLERMSRVPETKLQSMEVKLHWAVPFACFLMVWNHLFTLVFSPTQSPFHEQCPTKPVLCLPGLPQLQMSRNQQFMDRKQFCHLGAVSKKWWLLDEVHLLHSNTSHRWLLLRPGSHPCIHDYV